MSEVLFIDPDGNPLSFGLVYFYEPSSDDELIEKPVYSDEKQKKLLKQPIALNVDGELPDCFYCNKHFRQIVCRKDGTMLSDRTLKNTKHGHHMTNNIAMKAYDHALKHDPCYQWFRDITDKHKDHFKELFK